MGEAWQDTLTLILIAHLMSLCQLYGLRSFLSSWAWMRSFKSSWKYQIRKSSKKVAVISNSFKIDYKYFGCTNQSMTSFNWYRRPVQNLSWRLSTKTQVSPRLCWRKTLNLVFVRGTKVLALIFHLYCCHQFKAFFLKNITTKKTWLGSLDPKVIK